jgi:mono/diheme cytochrome c family protein
MRCTIIVGAIILAACSLSLAVASQRHGEQVVSEACSSCHSLTRVCGRAGQGEAYWSGTVRRMIRNGARVHSSEIDEVVSYLAGLEPGTPGLCR